MSKYVVTVSEVWTYDIEVDANSEDEARELAERKICEGTLEQEQAAYTYTLEQDEWNVEKISDGTV